MCIYVHVLIRTLIDVTVPIITLYTNIKTTHTGIITIPQSNNADAQYRFHAGPSSIIYNRQYAAPGRIYVTTVEPVAPIRASTVPRSDTVMAIAKLPNTYPACKRQKIC